MNFSKVLFLIMLFTSTIISISAKNWIGIWMGMEINLMSFIPLISSAKNKKSSKSIMIYFLTQSIGSIVLLFFILMSKFIMITPMMIDELMKSCIIIGLLIKVGAAPFHSWLPKMMVNLSWFEATILMTWQKITPLYMLSLIGPNKLIIISIILSALIGAIGGLNYSSMMKIMAFSSINHMSWMLLMTLSQMQWFKYLLLYSIIVIMTTSFFSYYKLYFINQIVSNSSTIMEKLTFSSLMLSMGGLPPFIGFLPKWMAIQSMINNNFIFLLMFMIMMSLLTLFYYMRMISPLMLFYSTVNKFVFKKKSLKLMYMLLMINIMLPMFSIYNF